MLSWIRTAAVGEWYRAGHEPAFEVVAIDEEAETIEIQYFDGSIEEIDFDSWVQLEAKPIAPPEDWSGPMDMDKQDVETDMEFMPVEDWRSSLEQGLSPIELR